MRKNPIEPLLFVSGCGFVHIYQASNRLTRLNPLPFHSGGGKCGKPEPLCVLFYIISSSNKRGKGLKRL